MWFDFACTIVIIVKVLSVSPQRSPASGSLEKTTTFTKRVHPSPKTVPCMILNVSIFICCMAVGPMPLLLWLQGKKYMSQREVIDQNNKRK